jgi:hypothetical protein
MIGEKVIVRSSPSGVWFGTLVARNGGEVELTNAHRLWRWWAAQGVSLSGVAEHGLHPKKLKECKIEPAVSRVFVREVCEILTPTETAIASIENAATPAVAA